MEVLWFGEFGKEYTRVINVDLNTGENIGRGTVYGMCVHVSVYVCT